MHKLQERVAKLQEQVGSPSRGAPLLSSNCSLLVFVFTCIHMCAHLRQVEKQHVHEEMMEQDLACFHLLKQSTSSNNQVDAILSLQRVAVSSFRWFKIIHRIGFDDACWCLGASKSLSFFPFGQDALIWISWLSSNSTNPRSDDSYEKGQTESHAFRKPSRRNRSPPCWTCGSWLMCFACKSETVKTTQDMEDRCGKHMNTSIKKLIDSIILRVDYRLWDVSLVAMIEMIEVFWEAKLHLTLQGLEPVARRDSLWGIRWASWWCFVRTASLVSPWCASTLASSCPLDSWSNCPNALATWL